MQIEDKLQALGLVLPEPPRVPPGIQIPFAWVRIHGAHAYISGHGPLNPDGSVAGPFGKVEAEVSLEQAYQAARATALSVLASLKRSIGDLDRVTAWLMVHGMVNAVPGSTASTNAINGFIGHDPGAVRAGSWAARPDGGWNGGLAAEAAGGRRRGGRDRPVADIAPPQCPVVTHTVSYSSDYG